MVTSNAGETKKRVEQLYDQLDFESQVLFDICRNPAFSLGALYDDVNKIEYVETKVSGTTNNYMIFLLVLLFLSIFILDSIWIFGFSFFLFFIIPFISRWAILKLILGRDRKLTEIAILELLNEKQLLQKYKTRFRIWQFSQFFRPFSFRHLWWWTLFIGLATVYLDYISEGGFIKLESEFFDADKFQFYTSHILKVLIIAIIAFIATNIIRELLHIRKSYVRSLTNFERLENRIGDFNQNIDELSDKTFPDLKSSIGRVLSRTELQVSIQKLEQKLEATEHEREDVKLYKRKQMDNFTSNIEKLTTNFISTIERVSDNKLKLILLETINTYLSNQRLIFNTERREIITKFSTLASLAKSLVDAALQLKTNDENEVEYFALLVIPPIRFLNNQEEINPIDYKTKYYCGDNNWEDYLENNIKATKENIKQNRCFIAIENVENLINIKDDLKKAANEARDLDYDKITKQLESFVEIDQTSGLPRKIKDQNKTKYNIVQKVPTESAKVFLPYAKVLYENYHNKCCYIKKFTNEDVETIIDDKTLKLLDYFAVKINSKWKFCLETKYDKDFDVACIELFHDNLEDNSQWEEVKGNLNYIFSEKNRIGLNNFYEE